MTEGNLRSLYATPLVEVRLERSAELNRRLGAIILERAASEPGVTRSNAGGWHSPLDLFDWPHEEIKVLKSAVVDLVMQTMQAINPELGDFKCRLALAAWANVSRRGDYNTLHNHPDFHWSGSYYVSSGAPDPDCGAAGCIEFRDPRAAVNMISAPGASGKPVVIRPEAGTMLLFPAWLEHFVHPHAGSEPRISIAFNALMAPAS